MKDVKKETRRVKIKPFKAKRGGKEVEIKGHYRHMHLPIWNKHPEGKRGKGKHEQVLARAQAHILSMLIGVKIKEVRLVKDTITIACEVKIQSV
jgi:hypothetical protein